MNKKNNNRKANILCWIALINMVVFCIVIGMSVAGWFTVATDSVMLLTIGAITSIFVGLSPGISVAIVIYVRIKYPENRFAKILMWILILMAVSVVLIVVLSILACVNCVNDIKNCGLCV